MILTATRNRRRFIINNSDLDYLLKILSNNVEHSFNKEIIHSTSIDDETCVSISDTLKQCLFKHNIADLISDGETIPILNPSSEQYSDNLVDISQPHKRFLFALSKFLEDSGEVNID